MALYQVTYVLSIERVGVTLATLISIAGAPIFVALISALFRGERYPPRVLLGLLAAVAGAALLVGLPAPDGPTSDRYREGIGFAVASAVFGALFVLAADAAAGVAHPLHSVGISFGIGALLLLPFALREGLALRYAAEGWLLLLYVAVVPTAIAQTMFLTGLKTTGTVGGAVASLLEPLVAAVVAALMLGEQIGLAGCVGAMILLVGIALVQRKGRGPAAAAPDKGGASSAPPAPGRSRAARPFTQIVAFGDSLSDTGDLLAARGPSDRWYFEGRFSNGPVWVEYLADCLERVMNLTGGRGIGWVTATRKSYPSDVSDGEWEFAAPYLALIREDAGQRVHSLREVFNALRWLVRTGAQWRFLPGDFPPREAVYQQARRWLAAGCFEAMAHDLRALLRLAAGRAEPPAAAILDSRVLRSAPESGARAGYDGHKRRKGPKAHAAVGTPGHLLALTVTPASAGDREQVAALAAAAQAATGQTVEVAFVDQGHTGARAAGDAAGHGIRLEVVTHAEPKRGFVLPPGRRVVERSSCPWS
jgi:drug/metabolite transporter (DMT)-like permease/transposase